MERRAADRDAVGQATPGQLLSHVNACARAGAGGVCLRRQDSPWDKYSLGGRPKLAVRLCSDVKKCGFVCTRDTTSLRGSVALAMAQDRRMATEGSKGHDDMVPFRPHSRAATRDQFRGR
jgi:hypothetical protein